MSWELGVIASFGIASFVLAYLGINLDETDKPLKTLFIGVSVLLLVFNGLVASEISTDAIVSGLSVTAMNGLMWVFVVTIIYILVKFLYETGKNMDALNKRKRDNYGIEGSGV